MGRYKFYFITFLLFMTFFVYKFTFSFFTDASNSTNNTFAAASIFPTPTPFLANHLVINEVGGQGDKKKEWVELFNPTGSPILINNWTITDDNSSDTLPNLSIPAGGYGIIVNNNTDVVVPGTAIIITLSDNAIGNGLNGPGDRVILKNSSAVIIDAMSYGNDTTVFNPAIPASPSNQSIARNISGLDTDTISDWFVDTTPTLGVANP